MRKVTDSLSRIFTFNVDTMQAITADYRQFIEDLKERVVSARISAARAITHETIQLYGTSGNRL